MKDNHKVSCIIPAYNEAPRITNIIKLVLSIEEIHEILIVNDGSTDKTLSVVEDFFASQTQEDQARLKLISNKVNVGKSLTVIKGVRNATYENILMLDADLKDLTTKNIRDLIGPVSTNKYDMAMGSTNRQFVRITKFDPFTGQRCLKKYIIEDIAENTDRFALEMKINEYVINNKIPFKSIIIENTKNTRKHDKMPYFEGLKQEIKMCIDIIAGVGTFKTIALMFIMLAYHIKFKRNL